LRKNNVKAMKTMNYVRNWTLALLVLATVGPGLFTAATAAILTVSNTSDSGAGSLRQAIQDAAAGDSINFAVSGTITLTSGELLVAKNLTIMGPGLASLAVSGNTNSRVFEISSNVTVSISGLTIRDGHAPDGATSGANGANGGGIFNAGALTLTSCAISSNSAGNGHSYVSRVGESGGAGGFGGGIYNAGTLTLASCTVSGNTGGGGGASLQLGFPAGGAGGLGGGIYNAGTLTLGASTVSGNGGGTGGAGGSSGGLGGPGGGVYNAGTATLSDCTLSSNVGGAGGLGGTVVKFITSFGQPGGAGGSGGGVFNAGTLSLIACTLGANAAGAGGTGGYGLGRGGNGGNGGNGGAICASTDTSGAVLRSSLVALNRAGAGGAAGRKGLSIATPGTPGLAGAGPDLYGPFGSQGHNLVGQADGSTGFANGVSGDLVGSTAHPVDPKLGPLQNNGGNTFTTALLAGSPALDTGDDALLSAPFNVGTDQRGLPRKSGTHVDIGAYESQVGALVAQAHGRIQLTAHLGTESFGLTVVAAPGTDGRIEASSDLRTWAALTNFTSAPDGTYEFTDLAAPSHRQRFYRVVTP
jgi:hypothetical protein